MNQILIPLIPNPISAAPKRDCVLVNDHRYCRDDDPTSKENGEIILGFTAAVIYALFMAHLYAFKNRGTLAATGILAPIIIFALYLILK
jgi:hypothetical protein